MSNYSSLKATINANVKANGNQEITGPVMNSVLNAMVDSLGAGYQYMGKAVPSTNPGTPDAKVFYLASDPGTYTNFNGLVVADGEVAFLKWDSAWSKEVTGAATAAKVTQLGQEVNGNITKEISWSNGYVQAATGLIKSSTLSRFSQPFLLKAGEKVTIGTQNSNIGIICSTNADSVAVGDTVTVIKTTSSSGQFETYEYTAEADIKIVLCVLASNYNLSFYDTDNLTEKINNVSVSQNTLTSGVFKHTFKLGDANKDVITTDIISGAKERASEIPLLCKKGDTIIYDISGAAGSGFSLQNPYRVETFLIPEGETHLSGTYLCNTSIQFITILFGDIVVNAIYVKETHIDTSLELLSKESDSAKKNIDALKTSNGVICQPIERASSVNITGVKGDTVIYDFSGEAGFGMSLEGIDHRIVSLIIPANETRLTGSYVLGESLTSVKALFGNIVVNAIYVKETHLDTDIQKNKAGLSVLDSRVTKIEKHKIIDIKVFYTSNPNGTSPGYLQDGEFYYNTDTKKLYEFYEDSTHETAYNNNYEYRYRGIIFVPNGNEGLIPQKSVIPLLSISSIDKTTFGFYYDKDNDKIVMTNPLTSPLQNYAVVEFAPRTDQVYIYNNVCYQGGNLSLVTSHIDNIEIENEDTLTDLSAIANSFDWSVSDGINTRMSQLYALFDALVTQYPDYVSKENAYTLAELNKPAYASDYETYIYHFRLTREGHSPQYFPRPKVLLVAGTHGNEIWSGLNLYCFMKQICEGSSANYFNMRATFDFEVIPCLSGYGIIHASRYNGNDVDINRNYDDNWQSGEHRGTAAFSESESQLVRNITILYNPFAAFDLHSYWNIDNGSFYSVLNNIEQNKKIARLCVKDICRTLILRLPSRFGAIDSDFYNNCISRYATEAGQDDSGTTAGWWARRLILCGTIEVSNNICYNDGEYQLNVEEQSANALSVAEYVLRCQIFKYCSQNLNKIANIYF